MLHALSEIAAKFRTRLGESLASIQGHNAPLDEATTPSLEALKAFSAGRKAVATNGDLAAAPFFKRAVQIDPKFAMAYALLGITTASTGESALAVEYISKAYQLRDRVSDAEKFVITTSYEAQVTGNAEKAQRTCESWARTYPRDSEPLGFLAGMIYPTLGEFEKGAEAAEKAITLDPDFSISYYQLSFHSQYLNRLDESLKAVKRATDRKLQHPGFLFQRYNIAFIKGDTAGMQREAALARGNPAAEDWMADQEAFVLAYAGHLAQAAQMSQRAADLAQRAGKPESAAAYGAGTAIWQALFGNAPAARRGATAALALSKSRDVEYGVAFALAVAGDSAAAQTLANDLEKRFPEDTSVRSSYLPTLRARLALNHGEPAKAIELLQSAVPHELGTPASQADGFYGGLYPVYVRGEAYLAAHQGAEAAAEFQKILNHRSIVVSDPVGALAHLQLGRALAMAGQTAKAKAAYSDFLALWKDADAGLPILQQAKAAYAKP